MSDAHPPIDRGRIGELFEQALALPPEARAGFLEVACSDKPDLRAELESLLAARARAPNRLERMAQEVMPRAMQALSNAGSPVGRTVSHYEILGLIGGGGMGMVYRARDLALGRLAALKFLRPHLVADADARARLESEARAASALDHPNIAVVYEIGAAEPRPRDSVSPRLFIAMAYYAGETIREKIARGALPVADALAYAVQVADGLARAHEAGIIHRDIKPANVMVTDRGEAKILDFGIARTAGVERTRQDATLGTVAYMSPEQTRGETVDHWTDMWSFGATLYEMLTAQRPFRGDDNAVMIHAIRHDEPEPLRRLRPEIPAPLAAIVETCLQKDPAARYRQTAELLSALRSLQADRAQTPAAQRPWHKRASVYAVGVIVLVAAIISFLLNTGEASDAGLATEPDLAALSAIPRLAVMPLVNLRVDTATDYLGYALADEIISRIGQFDGLVLRPSSIIRKYQGQTIDPREVGEALSVDYVLMGSYIEESDTLRVNIEMVNVHTGASEWREPIEMPYGNIFRLQDLVTHYVARRLELDLSPQARQRMDRDVSTNPTAYQLYLLALGNPHTTAEGARYAYELLHRSIELDSTFAPALAELGCRAFGLANFGFFTGAARDQAWLEAERTFEKALSLNPDQLQALNCQALLFAETGRAEAALEPLRHVLSILPNSSDAYISLGHVYRKGGLLEEAARIFERAKGLDPTNLRLSPAGLAYLYLGRYEEALELFALDPISPPSLLWQSMTLLHMGNAARARERFEEAVRTGSAGPFGLVAEAHLAYMDGDHQRGIEVVRALEARASEAGNNGEELYHFARLHILFGEHAAGVRLLEQAVGHGFFPYAFMLADPFIDSVRGDVAFQRVLAEAESRHETFRRLVSYERLPLY